MFLTLCADIFHSYINDALLDSTISLDAKVHKSLKWVCGINQPMKHIGMNMDAQSQRIDSGALNFIASQSSSKHCPPKNNQNMCLDTALGFGPHLSTHPKLRGQKNISDGSTNRLTYGGKKRRKEQYATCRQKP